MKKIILVIVMVACYVSQTDAQIRFGIKGGVNFENFNLKNAGSQLSLDNSAGWQIGALLQFKVPIVGLGLQPELLYTVKKANVNDESNSIQYFEIPVNVRWGLDLPLVKPFILAGPYFSYATHFSGDIFKSQVNRFDWGIGLGGGVEIWRLQVGVRYSWGLQNISDESDFKLKNNTFTVSAAFLF